MADPSSLHYPLSSALTLGRPTRFLNTNEIYLERMSKFYLLCLLISLLSLIACQPGSPPADTHEVAVKGLHSASISNDGRWLTIGSIHHGGSLWRTSDNERLFNWNHGKNPDSTLLSSDFSPEGDWALTADTHTLVLWDVKKGQSLRFWTSPGEVLDVALGPNGRFALLGLADYSAVIFDVRRGGIIHTLEHKQRVRSVDLSDDGRIAATASEDRTAKTWDTQTGKLIAHFDHNEEVQLVTLSPNGELVMSAAKYDKAVIWQAGTGDAKGEIPLGKEKVKRGIGFSAARFSLDGQQILTGRPDQVVQLWEVKTRKRLNTWRLPKRSAWKPTNNAAIAVGFKDKGYLAVGSNGILAELQ